MIVREKKRVSKKKYSNRDVEDLLSNIENEVSDMWFYLDALEEEGITSIPESVNSEIGLALARAEGIMKAANARTTYEQYGLRTWRFN